MKQTCTHYILFRLPLSPSLSLSLSFSVPVSSCSCVLSPILLVRPSTALRPPPSSTSSTAYHSARQRTERETGNGRTKKAAGGTEKTGRAMTRIKDKREEKRGTYLEHIGSHTKMPLLGVYKNNNCNNRIYLMKRIIILRRK